MSELGNFNNDAWDVFVSYSDFQKRGCLSLIKTLASLDSISEELKERRYEDFLSSLKMFKVDEWVVRELNIEDVREVVLSNYKSNNVPQNVLHYYIIFDHFDYESKKVCREMKKFHHYANDKNMNKMESEVFWNSFNNLLSQGDNYVLFNIADKVDYSYIVDSV